MTSVSSVSILQLFHSAFPTGRFYYCFYDRKVDGMTVRQYGHKIWAKDDIEANTISTQFGFQLEGATKIYPFEYRPSVLALQPGGLNRHDVIHAVCFLSFLAHKAGVADADAVCGDQSAIHEIIHFRAFGKDLDVRETKRNIARSIAFFENNVPGLPPKYVALPPYMHQENPTDDLNDPFCVSDWLK